MEHGDDAIKNTKKIMLLRGSPRSSLSYLEYIENIYDKLKKVGFNGEFSVVTSLINTLEKIDMLSKIDDSVFDFTLECFDRREELLGPEKGFPLEEVIIILKHAKRKFKIVRINYIVGLDSLESMKNNFENLVKLNLIDDVVANILSTYSPQMKTIRYPDSNNPDYLYAAREILLSLGLTPKRKGVKKHLFLDEDFQ